MESIKDFIEAEVHSHLRSDLFNNVLRSINTNIKFNVQEQVNLILFNLILIHEGV